MVFGLRGNINRVESVFGALLVALLFMSFGAYFMTAYMLTHHSDKVYEGNPYMRYVFNNYGIHAGYFHHLVLWLSIFIILSLFKYMEYKGLKAFFYWRWILLIIITPIIVFDFFINISVLTSIV